MIPAELLAEYATTRHEVEALQKRVDPILQSVASERKGLYFSRLKSPKSIFEKMLLGQYSVPLQEMEDLLAATIVLPNVPTGEPRPEFEEALKGAFAIVETRSNRTRQPSEFIYDDLHYILKLLDSPLLLNKKLLDWKFELQVKSYLEHGWSKATHDLMYKTKYESWRASRVEAQTKALVEMAEAALAAGADLLPETAERSYAPIDERVAISGLISEWWTRELPDDRRRLSLFTAQLMSIGKISLEEFESMLAGPRASELREKKSINVQQAIIILMIEFFKDQIVDELQSKGNQFLLITSEMEALSEPCRQVPLEVRIQFR